jgi:hypothetical protein
MRKNKIMTISIVLILALGLSGIAYAHWFDQVHITGEVKGGTVTLAFDDYEPPQCFEVWRDLDGNSYPDEFKDKDVGSCTANYADPVIDPHTLKDGFKTLEVLIDNAYPSYEVHSTFIIHNIGTIPFLLCDFLFEGAKYEKDPETKVCDLIFIPVPGATPAHWEIWEDYDGSGTVTPDDELVINMYFVDGILPFQYDPCYSDKKEFDFHFKQEAQQCHRYKITISIVAVQWNKECLEDWP